MSSAPVYLVIGQAAHFASWERPFYERYVQLIKQPSTAYHVHAFGPDVMDQAAALPAHSRSIMLFPGFGWNPFFDRAQRDASTEILVRSFDVVFANPGPIASAFAHLPHLEIVPFSLNVSSVPFRPRAALNSLLHVSADYPQKDWRRSLAVMERTGLRHEVFPPRGSGASRYWPRHVRVRRSLNYRLARARLPQLPVPRTLYLKHEIAIQKYAGSDGFVHVAGPIPPYTDGLYTASLAEAGLSGAILFWHDTHNLGGTLRTVFEVSADPSTAAKQILEVREGVNIHRHSIETREEIAAHFDPEAAVAVRCNRINALFDS